MPVTFALRKPSSSVVVRRTLLTSLMTISSFCFAFLEHDALADDAQRGLSQLDFDRPSNKSADAALELLEASAEVSPEQISAVVSETSEPIAPAKPALKPGYDVPVNDPPAPAATARARLEQPAEASRVTALPATGGPVAKFEWTRSGDGSQHFLPPRLKGPAADKGADASITTVAAWEKSGAGCQEPKDSKGACAKAVALKELFSRFSGSDDVYSSQCVGFTCPDPTQEPRLTGFAIAPKKGGEFRMLAVGDSCHYQLEAPKGPGSWVMLEGVRGSCSCVPKSCS